MPDVTQYEDELDAARDAVKALGGAKKVGTLLWPDKTTDNAARYLLDCLNGQRAERLSPSQVLLLMRMARQVGFHGLAEYFMAEAGYSRPVPVNAEAESMVLAQQIDVTMDRLSLMVGRLERLRGVPAGS
ncbi:hypothetical protein [Xylophilus ampelinus]|uniref:Uncharacterized protein n=1 Tax=Xylophilus ampelinus TaxID=54067 RepID=A0A318SXR8_9BURK|nr:hypothetical protein [Xylophilus ampelinus]MCS4509157.1 hypothetical protein [Xylophilus ampelinus]PYE79817.1 hypothetical protein DFQ15_101137 [Xylophilus ampelinus]